MGKLLSWPISFYHKISEKNLLARSTSKQLTACAG